MYLLLAQRLIREDSATATIRLGLGPQAASKISCLTSTEMAKVASTELSLFDLRLDAQQILACLAGPASLHHMHTAILLAGIKALH